MPSSSPYPVLLIRSGARYVQKADFFEDICGKWFGERIVRMRGDERHASLEPDDEACMVEVAGFAAELDYVALVQAVCVRFLGKRSDALVSDEKTVKKFHARPGCGPVVRGCVDQPVTGV